jgi:hypothetical protein
MKTLPALLVLTLVTIFIMHNAPPSRPGSSVDIERNPETLQKDWENRRDACACIETGKPLMEISSAPLCAARREPIDFF